MATSVDLVESTPRPTTREERRGERRESAFHPVQDLRYSLGSAFPGHCSALCGYIPSVEGGLGGSARRVKQRTMTNPAKEPWAPLVGSTLWSYRWRAPAAYCLGWHAHGIAHLSILSSSDREFHLLCPRTRTPCCCSWCRPLDDLPSCVRWRHRSCSSDIGHRGVPRS